MLLLNNNNYIHRKIGLSSKDVTSLGNKVHIFSKYIEECKKKIDKRRQKSSNDNPFNEKDYYLKLSFDEHDYLHSHIHFNFVNWIVFEKEYGSKFKLYASADKFPGNSIQNTITGENMYQFFKLTDKYNDKKRVPDIKFTCLGESYSGELVLYVEIIWKDIN